MDLKIIQFLSPVKVHGSENNPSTVILQQYLLGVLYCLTPVISLLLGCVRLVGHIPLSVGWTSVRIIKLKYDDVTPGAGYARGPCKGPLSGPALGVSDS